MSRRLARELCMKVLFEMHMNKDFDLGKIKYHLEDENFSGKQDDYICAVLGKAIDNMAEIDKIIEDYSEGWKLNRIANVDLAILRLALSEILYMKDIPYGVSIDEAIEIAKIYSSGETPSFINGILGGYVEENLKKGEGR
ncbi:MAG: transcription antitermination factor NusB [Candidatus Alkaliphilus sp. MAG34]|nr:transcription antitermination factor NusB [Clostridiales bacterium]